MAKLGDWHGRSPWFKGTPRQGPPTLRHQCQPVQDPPSLEQNRRLVVKSRLSEVFSAVNGSVGPSHLFVISSNLTSINARTIGSVLTLHRHFHLSPLDPLAQQRQEARKGPLALWHKVNGTETGTRLVCPVKRCRDFFAFTGHCSLATRHYSLPPCDLQATGRGCSLSTTSVNRPRPPSLPQPSRLQHSPPGRGQHATTCYVFRFRRKFGELSFRRKSL